MDQLHGLTTAQVNRLRKLLNAFEAGELYPPSKQPAKLVHTRSDSMLIGKTNAVIPGRDDGTGTPVPGSGDVTIWRFNNDGELEETDTIVEAFNIVTSDVADDAWVVVAREALSGRFLVIVEDCG